MEASRFYERYHPKFDPEWVNVSIELTRAAEETTTGAEEKFKADIMPAEQPARL